MEVIGKQIQKEISGDMIVEFVGQGGDVISVHIKHTEDDNLTKANAEDRAKVMLLQVAAFEGSEADDEGVTDAADQNSVSPAVISLELERARNANAVELDGLDAGLEHTFPASDPVSIVARTIPGSGPVNGIFAN